MALDRKDRTREALTIAHEMGIGAAAIARRKDYLELTAEDAKLLRELHARLGHEATGFVEDFYVHLLRFRETRALIPDGATLKRLKRKQTAYFNEFTAGDYGWDYAVNRLRVGIVHQHLGLRPKYYIGAYSRYLGALVSNALRLFEGADGAAVCRALIKVAFLDVNLGLDAYFHAEARRLRQLKIALDSVMEAVFIFRPDDFGMMYVNHGAERMLGFGGKAMLAMHPAELIAGYGKTRLRTLIRQLAQADDPCLRLKARLVRRMQEALPVDLLLQLIETVNGHGLVIATARDISDLVRHEAELERLAMHDDLTGLPNRRLLQKKINAYMADGRSAALVLVGLDRFKAINETIGYANGDKVLLKVVKRLRNVGGKNVLLARMSGDVFALLAPVRRREEPRRIAGETIGALETSLQLGEYTLNIQASAGIAEYPRHGAKNAGDLMRQAEVAMEAAKRAHTDLVVYDDDLEQYRLEHLNLLGELRGAIARDELTLYYQPKVAMKSRRIAGVEALVRWIHPQRGFIAPDLFIPLAEESAVIHQLTEWVMKQAIEQRKRWQVGGLPDDFRISVNVTAANLENAAFVDMVRKAGKAAEIRPAMLVLEVTENGLMHDPERAHKALHRLHDIGFPISLDDFGTGYSSLAYLHDLPVQEMKIDQSFVRRMLADEKSAAIVQNTIRLAHGLNLRVVAEGVEDEAAWHRLAELGCHEAQGYYMGKPMPAPALERWLRESPWGYA